MTAEEIRQRLGLLPFAQYRALAGFRSFVAGLPRGSNRRQGLTTRMIVRALADVSDGRRVYIGSPFSHNQRRIVDQAINYATRLGLDTNLIWAGEIPRGADRECRQHYDHYRGD